MIVLKNNFLLAICFPVNTTRANGSAELQQFQMSCRCHFAQRYQIWKKNTLQGLWKSLNLFDSVIQLRWFLFLFISMIGGALLPTFVFLINTSRTTCYTIFNKALIVKAILCFVSVILISNFLFKISCKLLVLEHTSHCQ